MAECDVYFDYLDKVIYRNPLESRIKFFDSWQVPEDVPLEIGHNLTIYEFEYALKRAIDIFLEYDENQRAIESAEILAQVNNMYTGDPKREFRRLYS